ncbi:App1 family protein [Runella sp.]|uniref:App1 family protein n=1 Tax=Runella sp. TaxID=1960881 RepID=UPI0026279EF1|nr:App1 family protein [Runella sp.]
MGNKIDYSGATVKVYHGYGHKGDLVVYGHVLAGKLVRPSKFTNNALTNSIHLAKLFFVKPIPNVQVELEWGNQRLYCTTEADGFFKFEWQSAASVEAGWHHVNVNLLTPQGYIAATGQGKIFVPHSTQYGFISDIDDTVLVSHSADTGKKLRVMFTENPRSRKTFADVVKYYQLLALAHTEPELPNPFFYVSNSEWNLYDDLNEFFKHNDLPKGAFLLNSIKKWYQLFKTGNTKHQGKLMRVVRILKVFPKQRFVLLGDNSQKDPEIYATIANKYPDRIVAIYLRNISLEKEAPTLHLLESIQNKEIHTCLFKHTDEAIAHSISIGLLN